MHLDRFNQFVAQAAASGVVFYHNGRLDEGTVASIGALLRRRLPGSFPAHRARHGIDPTLPPLNAGAPKAPERCPVLRKAFKETALRKVGAPRPGT